MCIAENTECTCSSGPGACAQNGCACGASTVTDAVVPCDDFWKLNPTAKQKVSNVNLDCADHGASSQCHVIRPGDEAGAWASTYCTADDIGSFELGGEHKVKCCLPEIPDKRTDCSHLVGELCDCPDGLKGVVSCLRPKGDSYCECRYAEPKPAEDGAGPCGLVEATDIAFRDACLQEPLLTDCRAVSPNAPSPTVWRTQFCKKTTATATMSDGDVFAVYCCRPEAPQ